MSSVVETRKAPTSLGSSPKLRKSEPEKEESSADGNVPDNYVSWSLRNQKPRPPITFDNLLENIQWLTFAILTITPSIAIYGLFTHKLRWETFVWSVLYYFITGLGESLSAVPRVLLY